MGLNHNSDKFNCPQIKRWFIFPTRVRAVLYFCSQEAVVCSYRSSSHLEYGTSLSGRNLFEEMNNAVMETTRKGMFFNFFLRVPTFFIIIPDLSLSFYSPTLYTVCKRHS
jgi:hypothetical protein